MFLRRGCGEQGTRTAGRAFGPIQSTWLPRVQTFMPGFGQLRVTSDHWTSFFEAYRVTSQNAGVTMETACSTIGTDERWAFHFSIDVDHSISCSDSTNAQPVQQR